MLYIVAPEILSSLPKTRKSHQTCLQKWEKQLPKRYVVALTPGAKYLVIKVEIQTTDTTEVKSGPALVDCGATGSFMSRNYIECNQLTTCKVSQLIPVYNVDGFPNESRSITEIVDAILHFNGHSKRTTFTVTNLGRQDIILRFTWLKEHNPEIDWQTQKVSMSQCPSKCHTCQAELQEEQKAFWKSAKDI